MAYLVPPAALNLVPSLTLTSPYVAVTTNQQAGNEVCGHNVVRLEVQRGRWIQIGHGVSCWRETNNCKKSQRLGPARISYEATKHLFMLLPLK